MYFWLFFTAWWLSIIIQEKHRHQWLIPTVIWGMIMVRLITWHVKILHWILYKVKIVWDFVTDRVYSVLNQRYQRLIAGATVTVGVILLGTFIPSETDYSKRKDRAVSFLVVLLLSLVYL